MSTDNDVASGVTIVIVAGAVIVGVVVDTVGKWCCVAVKFCRALLMD